MARQPDPGQLQNLLGHRFADGELLARALTHPSAAGPARPDNQRLEFLGDRVLGLFGQIPLVLGESGE